jgi:hypothetical protein
MMFGPTAGRAALMALCITGAVTSSVVGQGVRLDLLPPLGTEVRVTLLTDAGTESSQGTLVQGGEYGLVLEADRGRRVHRIPSESLLGLEMSQGRDHARGGAMGLLIGTAAGAVTLGIIGALVTWNSVDCQVCGPTSGFLLWGSFGAAIGAPTGALAGLLIGWPEWKRVW